MKPKSPFVALGTMLLGLPVAAAATIQQIDFERTLGETVPNVSASVTQAGWTSVVAANSAPTTNHTLTAPNITITAGGTGYFQGRSTVGTWGGITGTSWNDMVGDTVSARGQAGTATVDIAMVGLTDSQEYSLTVWHNVGATDGPSFATGFYTITPSVVTGTLVGTPTNGQATNWDKNDTVTDSSFVNSVINFTSTGGAATIRLTSASPNQYLVMSGLQLESVPETSTAALLSGLGLLALLRRRRG